MMRGKDEGQGTQTEAQEFLTHYKEKKKPYHEGSQTLKRGDHSSCKISCIEGIQKQTQRSLEELALTGPTLSRG